MRKDTDELEDMLGQNLEWIKILKWQMRKTYEAPSKHLRGSPDSQKLTEEPKEPQAESDDDELPILHPEVKGLGLCYLCPLCFHWFRILIPFSLVVFSLMFT